MSGAESLLRECRELLNDPSYWRAVKRDYDGEGLYEYCRSCGGRFDYLLGQALAGKAVLNSEQLLKLAAALDSDSDTVRARLKKARNEYEASQPKKGRRG